MSRQDSPPTTASLAALRARPVLKGAAVLIRVHLYNSTHRNSTRIAPRKSPISGGAALEGQEPETNIKNNPVKANLPLGVVTAESAHKIHEPLENSGLVFPACSCNWKSSPRSNQSPTGSCGRTGGPPWSVRLFGELGSAKRGAVRRLEGRSPALAGVRIVQGLRKGAHKSGAWASLFLEGRVSLLSQILGPFMPCPGRSSPPPHLSFRYRKRELTET